jgi:hypothetical protein
LSLSRQSFSSYGYHLLIPTPPFSVSVTSTDTDVLEVTKRVLETVLNNFRISVF